MADTRRSHPSTDDAVAVLAGAGAVAGSYAAVGLSPAFLGSPLERFSARAMPAAVVTFAIEQFGSLGQLLNLTVASLLTALAVAALVRLAIAAGDRLGNRLVPVVLTGVLAGAFATVVTGGVGSAAGAALGGSLVVGLAELVPAAADRVERDPDPARRRVLGALTAAVGLGTAALARPSSSTGASPTIPEDADPTVRYNLRSAAEQSLAVDGIEPLVSRDFYKVDINAADPVVDPDEWSLSVTGEVEATVTYSLEDLRSMESRTTFNTLRCVGDPLNGEQMDNALWTGVPAEELIERADPDGQCDCVKLHAVDDYYQVFPAEALRGGLLAYEMNGRDLPRAHGYPLRALVPGHWGEVQVKWLTEIEFLERDAEGYWEKRGWHGTGPVNAVAKLHAVNDLDDGRKQVAGHTYAGTRGVSAVEVSTDFGQTWAEARLSDELPGDDVWRQWVYEYEPPDGRHDVIVRAIEDDGTVQDGNRSRSHPSGATGWVSETVE